MRRHPTSRFLRIAGVAALVSAVACGKSPQQQQGEQIEQIQKNAQQLAQRAAQMSNNGQEVAKGFEALAKGMAAAAGGEGQMKPVEPVDFKELQAMLPEVEGWEKSHPEAERMTMPVSFAYASTRYKKKDSEITEKITDSGFNQLLVAPLTMMLAVGYSKESTSGFEKSTTVGGYPAFEKWDKKEKSGEVTVFVNQRFVVELEGTGMPDNKELQAFVARTDLKKLAVLK
jgi:hypothetical protein